MRKYVALFLISLGLGMIWHGTRERSAEASEVAVRAVQIMTAQSADETASDVVGAAYMPQCRESAVYVDWNAGVTAGVVEVETAHSAAYGDTWANLATVTFSGTAPNLDVVQITGVHLALRARISTVLTGGTVDVHFVCN